MYVCCTYNVAAHVLYYLCCKYGVAALVQECAVAEYVLVYGEMEENISFLDYLDYVIFFVFLFISFFFGRDDVQT